MQCIAKLESENRTQAKLELVSITSNLMPMGKPGFKDIIQYPPISTLVVQEGAQVIIKVVFLMVKDLCDTLNVKRPMNEDQMIECAAMLVDECDTFRLEDYAMMFAMGKRGELVKIMDRIDLSMVSEMMNRYYTFRRIAGEKIYEEEHKNYEPIILDLIDENEHGILAGIMTAWKNEDTVKEQADLERLKEERDVSYNKMNKIGLGDIVKQLKK